VGPADQGVVAAVAAGALPVGAYPAAATPVLNGASEPVDPAQSTQLSAEEIEKREMTRRELLTYAWGGALVLVGGAVGLGLYGFMYPRFRAGEFGGEFYIPVAELPAVDAGPNAFSSGKFWLVQDDELAPKALYMVCTHLGCLYKWEASKFRFECPCHGSKFSKDGYYIEGPAPRSLDTFATTVNGDIITVDTGAKTLGAPSMESPARVA
jgi:cytochrome b6-f complex iron-sulfur subunit